MIPTTLFSNPLKQLKNSGKCYTYDYNFIIKDIMQEQQNKRKRYIEEVMMGVKGGVGELGLSSPTTLPVHGFVHQSGSSLKPTYLEGFVLLCYVLF